MLYYDMKRIMKIKNNQLQLLVISYLKTHISFLKFVNVILTFHIKTAKLKYVHFQGSI
jgi:hypothetical protein